MVLRTCGKCQQAFDYGQNLNCPHCQAQARFRAVLKHLASCPACRIVVESRLA